VAASNDLLDRIFKEFDVNNDGALSREEISQLVKSMIIGDTANVVIDTVENPDQSQTK
jgi:Ca2+-binding EF-hand superfamily protein